MHMIATTKEYRRKGIGSILFSFYEREALRQSTNLLGTKVYLLVGEYNDYMKQYTLQKGYRHVCDFDGLFRKNITDKLYEKEIKRKLQQC